VLGASRRSLGLSAVIVIVFRPILTGRPMVLLLLLLELVFGKWLVEEIGRLLLFIMLMTGLPPPLW
jgi:hypothetical protein